MGGEPGTWVVDPRLLNPNTLLEIAGEVLSFAWLRAQGRTVRPAVVHPAFHNKDLCGIVKVAAIELASRHAKVRREGYPRGAHPSARPRLDRSASRPRRLLSSPPVGAELRSVRLVAALWLAAAR